MSPPPDVDGGSTVAGDVTIDVLHVDDESAVSDVTAEFLERASDAIVVETAEDPNEGLERLAEGSFDCVVSDHEMGGASGIEFLRAVREEYEDLPFILFTGKGSEEIASDAISAGVTDYLQKEVGPDQYAVLANRIENAVERHRVRESLEEERSRRTALFENTPDPIMTTEIEDGELVVAEVNDAFEETFGFDAGEVVGRTVTDSVIPERSREEFEWIQERVMAGEAVETEVRRDTAMGPREFVLRAIPFGVENGEPDGDYAWYTDVTARKERERRLAALSEAFPDLAFIIDEEGRHVELLASPSSENLLYDDPDAIVGQRFHDFLPTDRADEFLSVVRSTLETDRPQKLAYELDVQAGARWFEARMSPLSTEIGGKRAVTWVSRDVTERVEREQALRALHDIATGITSHDAQEAVCRRTVEAAEFVLDFDLCVINIEEDGMLPITALSEGLPPDGATVMSVEEGLAGKTYRTGESFLVDDVRDVEEANPQGPYQSAISIPIGDHGVFQAVTEETESFDETDLELAELLVSHAASALDRLGRERALARNQRRYEAVFDNPLSMIGRLDLDGTVIDANRTALAVVDRRIEDVAGEPFWETPWWSHSDELRAELREWIARAAEGEYVRFEADHPTADGGTIVVDGVLHPVEDDDGEPVEIVVAARDVTETKERERALERQNERLDEFASVVSHDLRNPLAVLSSSLELAAESGDPEQFDRCRRALHRMETLVDDLLTLSREGSAVENPAPVDLGRIAERCWETVQTGDARLRVETEATVRANASRLGQLLENLFRNSVEHSSTSPRSTPSREDAVEHGSTSPDSQARQDAVEHSSTSEGAAPESDTAVDRGGDEVVVTIGAQEDGFYVEDTGPGIPPDDRERVFESGYSTTRDGTGFGLSIVDEIAAAHGWEVRATEGRGGGARFEVVGVEFV